MTRHILVLLIVTSSVLVSAQSRKYVFPTEDERTNASPPNAEGTLRRVDVSEFEIATREGKKVVALLTESTRLFTVYGGMVRRIELKPGQNVQIWFEGCRPSERLPKAAVIIFASKRAGDPFP